jgi:uncharacterized protein
MSDFSPISSLAGGALIGLSAVLLLWLSGRLAGVSGILYGVFTRDADERDWRLLFVVGLIAGGWLYSTATGDPLASREGFPLWRLVTAGLLVGMGTRLGSGCTSGHAVCGISRLSVRSMIATVTFLVTAIAVATLARIAGGA